MLDVQMFFVKWKLSIQSFTIVKNLWRSMSIIIHNVHRSKSWITLKGNLSCNTRTCIGFFRAAIGLAQFYWTRAESLKDRPKKMDSVLNSSIHLTNPYGPQRSEQGFLPVYQKHLKNTQTQQEWFFMSVA